MVVFGRLVLERLAQSAARPSREAAARITVMVRRVRIKGIRIFQHLRFVLSH
jgi:hypothetical protein